MQPGQGVRGGGGGGGEGVGLSGGQSVCTLLFAGTLSSAETPSVGKRREDGEERDPPRAFVSLLPSLLALLFPSPYSSSYRKEERDLCGGESCWKMLVPGEWHFHWMKHHSQECFLET